jgi:hypothetical protein
MPTMDYANFPALNLWPSGGRAQTHNIYDAETFEMWNSVGRARPMSLLLLGERGVPPVLTSAFVLTPTRVLIIYSMRMLRDIDLMFAPNYVITADVGSAPRAVTTVTVPHSSGVYAFLDLDGPLSPGTLNYNVQISRVRSLRGVPIDPNEDSVDFNGNAGIAILSVVALPNNQVRVNFTAPVLNNAALNCLEIYSIVPDPSVLPALSPVHVLSVQPSGTPASYVILNTTEHRNLEDYTVQIAVLEAA